MSRAGCSSCRPRRTRSSSSSARACRRSTNCFLVQCLSRGRFADGEVDRGVGGACGAGRSGFDMIWHVFPSLWLFLTEALTLETVSIACRSSYISCSTSTHSYAFSYRLYILNAYAITDVLCHAMISVVIHNQARYIERMWKEKSVWPEQATRASRRPSSARSRAESRTYLLKWRTPQASAQSNEARSG